MHIRPKVERHLLVSQGADDRHDPTRWQPVSGQLLLLQLRHGRGVAFPLATGSQEVERSANMSFHSTERKLTHQVISSVAG